MDNLASEEPDNRGSVARGGNGADTESGFSFSIEVDCPGWLIFCIGAFLLVEAVRWW